MKRLTLILLLIATTAVANTNITGLTGFRQTVRWRLNISNDPALPDTVLNGFAHDAVIWTSVDVGGVEAQYKIITADAQAFYILPDSIVDILSATLLDSPYVRSVRSVYPQYYEVLYGPSHIVSTDERQASFGYHWWSDTVQIMPTPVQVDTIYFNCYVEHGILEVRFWDGDLPFMDTSYCTGACDSTHIDTTIYLQAPFIEAAILYACHLVGLRMDDWTMAANYLELYGKARERLIAKYRRKFDQITPGE